VDVSEGEAGVQELLEMAPTLEGKILLSARAQMALWTILERTMQSIERQIAATADIGGPTGEAVRAKLEKDRLVVINQAQELVRLNNSAISQGVPQAIMGEWFPQESTRTAAGAGAGVAVATNPIIWTVVISVAVAAVILATAITVGIIWTQYIDM